MPMESNFDALFEKFLREDIASEELKMFLHLARQPDHQEKIRELIKEKFDRKAYSGLSDETKLEELFRQMLNKTVEERNETGKTAVIAPVVKRFSVVGVAASILLALGIGVYLYFEIVRNGRPQVTSQQAHTTEALINDIPPGGNRAILTLSDGSVIILDSSSNGRLAMEGSAAVIKLADGRLAYEQAGAGIEKIVYNTMSTPPGGQYELILPDGSKVWLNAASSITYPTVFEGKERKVKIRGEAYFEIAHNASMPFIVGAEDMKITVLGTHFNVNAYPEEAVAKTTLLQGAVKIECGTNAALLKPGQQAQLAASGKLNVEENADLEAALAWKNGLFYFNGDDLKSIILQLARWYDLEVHYEGSIPKRRFSGYVFRHLNVSEALKVLEMNQVRFRLEGKKLTVMP